MPSDISKRKSLLFPFRSQKPEPPKFEVINRKKSPLVKQQTPPTTPPTTAQVPRSINTNPIANTIAPSKQTPKQAPKPRIQAQANLTIPPVPSVPEPKRSSFDFLRPASTQEKSSNELITDSDLPNSLSVIGAVPPVPQYNTNFIVPDSIQDRTKSSSSRPLRRKPPPSYQSQESLPESHESPRRSLEQKTHSLAREYDQSTAAGIDQVLEKKRNSLIGSIKSEEGVEVLHGNKASNDISRTHTTTDPKSQEDERAPHTPTLPTQFSRDEAEEKEAPQTPNITVTAASFSSQPSPEITSSPPPKIPPPQLPTAQTPNSPIPQIHIVKHDEELLKDSSAFSNQERQTEPIESQSIVVDVATTSEESTPRIVAAAKSLQGKPQSEQSSPQQFPSESFTFPKSGDDFHAKIDDDDFIEDFRPPHLTNTISRLSNASSSEFFDADEEVNPSVEDVRTEGDQDLIQNDANTSPSLKQVPVSYTQNEARESDIEENDDVRSSASSIIVKPLNFHKKNLSTASSGSTAHIYTSPTQKKEKTHEKKISISDEILRDIEKFQPGIASYQHNGKLDDNVSPVTPLNYHAIGTEATAGGLLEEDLSYSDELEETRSLSGYNTLEPEYAKFDQGSLFNDSSDDELTENIEKLAVNDYEIDDKISSQSSKTSSTRAEINYEPTPIAFAHDESETNREIQSIQSSDLHHEFSGLPRSNSYQNLNSHISSSDQSSLQNTGAQSSSDQFSKNADDRFSTGADVDSQYSFNSQPQQQGRSLHIVNNDLSDKEEELDEDSDIDRGINYVQETERRTFHVVNDGNYSDSEDDGANSFDITQHDDRLNTDFVVHQQDLGRRSSNSGDQSSGLSFTAKSPIHSGFTFDQTHLTNQYDTGINPPEFTLDSASIITPPNASTHNLTSQDNSPNSNSTSEQPLNKPLLKSYDRRDEIVAPVQYLDQYGTGKTRRPPPSDTPAATRVGRSASISTPTVIDYTTVKEEHEKEYTHIPAKSSYVETLRFGAGTTNSVVSAQSWGLPIGISEADPRSKKASSKSAQAYKRPSSRVNKVDLKHGKIKPRLLASEFDEEDESEVPITSTAEKRESTELERFKTYSSANSFGVLSSPTMTSTTGLSPRKEPISVFPSVSNALGSPSNTPTNSNLARSGTLVSDYRVSSAIELGRSGTLLNKNAGATLFIANPDADSD